jgi:hypothetical protein
MGLQFFHNLELLAELIKLVADGSTLSCLD